MSAFLEANAKLISMMKTGLIETVQMTLFSTLFAYILGIPLGVLLVVTEKGHIRENPVLNQAVGTVVNVLRSIPFLIMILMLFPLTRIVMGTALGVRAAIFPLVIAAFPYVARMIESSLKEVDSGVIEAAQSMGSSTMQIIFKVMLPEAVPSLINGAAISMTTILGYTAMAGAVGAGGLGKIAIDYGMYRYDYTTLYAASILLVLLVQIIQIAGTKIALAVDRRRR
ncbi:MAG: methionine ABC transporter permease [Christensenellales bacterium]|jgi:D-methionine transport system permease protein